MLKDSFRLYPLQGNKQKTYWPYLGAGKLSSKDRTCHMDFADAMTKTKVVSVKLELSPI